MNQELRGFLLHYDYPCHEGRPYISLDIVCDMSRNNIEKLHEYLDESFDSFDFFDQDDSDVDRDFSLPNTRKDLLPRAGPSRTFTNTGSDTSNKHTNF